MPGEMAGRRLLLEQVCSLMLMSWRTGRANLEAVFLCASHTLRGVLMSLFEGVWEGQLSCTWLDYGEH